MKPFRSSSLHSRGIQKTTVLLWTLVVSLATLFLLVSHLYIQHYCHRCSKYGTDKFNYNYGAEFPRDETSFGDGGEEIGDARIRRMRRYDEEMLEKMNLNETKYEKLMLENLDVKGLDFEQRKQRMRDKVERMRRDKVITSGGDRTRSKKEVLVSDNLKNLYNLEEDELCKKFVEKQHYYCDDVEFLPTNFSFDKDDEVDDKYFPKCKYSLVNDLEYLPDPKFFKCVSKFPSLEMRDAQERMFRKISKVQNPKYCTHPQSMEFHKPTWVFGKDTYNFQTKLKNSQPVYALSKVPKWNLLGWLHHGYAYNLFVFTWNAGNHWASGVSVLTSNSKYRFSDIKCGKSWSCLLSPLSNCSINDISPSNYDKVLIYYDQVGYENMMDLSQVCKPYGKYDFENGRCLCEDQFMPSRNIYYTGCAPYHTFDFDKIPRRNYHRQIWESRNPKTYKAVREGDDIYFSQLAPAEVNPAMSRNTVHAKKTNTRKKFGFLWEHAQWLWYLHKDSPRKAELDSRLQAIGFNTSDSSINAVGIHVRHGDACHDPYQNHRVCLPLSKYMEGVKKLESLYGKYDLIYLATDDPQVILDAEPYTAEGYTFVFQKISRIIYETGDSLGVDVRLEFNDPEMVLEIALDIWAVSHCKAFVGSFASSVAWVAYELMVGRSGLYPPFISVDLSYGHVKNVGRFLFEPNG